MTEKWTTIVVDHIMDFGHDTRQFIITTEDGDEIARTSGPDLLEAAEDALSALKSEGYTEYDSVVQDLVSAIAKGKGG
ncbi:hypothetical protein LCGC14_1552030 [marine sediment metagenome]|uniref:Uncharacterized protein n=1 Tax=marine sediment metagenome TaxID=412755 RepID=A0A0F9IPX6_9ZZZZ